MPKTPQEQRKLRLKNDYQEMVNIRGDIVQWRPIKGAAPFVEEYELQINFKTIVGVGAHGPQYRDEHTINLQIGSNYPREAPVATMLTSPSPYHPNWYINGKWCHGSWIISEALGHFVIRLIRTLNFDLEITHPGSPANSSAKDWFNSKKRSGLFPLSNTMLPDPTKKVEEQKKTFNIKSSPGGNSNRFKIN